jgi:hypothetical protein
VRSQLPVRCLARGCRRSIVERADLEGIDVRVDQNAGLAGGAQERSVSNASSPALEQEIGGRVHIHADSDLRINVDLGELDLESFDFGVARRLIAIERLKGVQKLSAQRPHAVLCRRSKG